MLELLDFLKGPRVQGVRLFRRGRDFMWGIFKEDAHAGRLPAFASGNADVDIEMLSCARFALLVTLDDEEREFAYTKGAEKSLAKAEQLGWTVVSIKKDGPRCSTALARHDRTDHPDIRLSIVVNQDNWTR
jgi:hypothetical protein